MVGVGSPLNFHCDNERNTHAEITYADTSITDCTNADERRPLHLRCVRFPARLEVGGSYKAAKGSTRSLT